MEKQFVILKEIVLILRKELGLIRDIKNVLNYMSALTNNLNNAHSMQQFLHNVLAFYPRILHYLYKGPICHYIEKHIQLPSREVTKSLDLYRGNRLIGSCTCGKQR